MRYTEYRDDEWQSDVSKDYDKGYQNTMEQKWLTATFFWSEITNIVGLFCVIEAIWFKGNDPSFVDTCKTS